MLEKMYVEKKSMKKYFGFANFKGTQDEAKQKSLFDCEV